MWPLPTKGVLLPPAVALILALGLLSSCGSGGDPTPSSSPSSGKSKTSQPPPPTSTSGAGAATREFLDAAKRRSAAAVCESVTPAFEQVLRHQAPRGCRDTRHASVYNLPTQEIVRDKYLGGGRAAEVVARIEGGGHTLFRLRFTAAGWKLDGIRNFPGGEPAKLP